MPGLTDGVIYLFIGLGVLVSLIMPVVRKLAAPPDDKTMSFFKRVGKTLRPYAFMAVFSALAALVILAGVRVKGLPVDSRWGAFLMGYFVDATIQKLQP